MNELFGPKTREHMAIHTRQDFDTHSSPHRAPHCLSSHTRQADLFVLFLVSKATRSRRPKSRLERNMEEERQARARAPEPRVPVVSRPTAARTQHMAEIAKTLSSRHSCTDDHGRVLCPAYPVSTVNAPVPRALAEAVLLGAGGARSGRGEGHGGGAGATSSALDGNGGSGSRNLHSRGSSKGGATTVGARDSSP